MDACKSRIDDIVLNTLQKLDAVYVDLGYSRENTDKEYNTLVEETREFFNSKLLPFLELKGKYFYSFFKTIFYLFLLIWIYKKLKYILLEQLEKQVKELLKSVELSINELGNPAEGIERINKIKSLPLHQQTDQLNVSHKFLYFLWYVNIIISFITHENLKNDLEKLREQRIASLQVLHEKLHSLYL